MTKGWYLLSCSAQSQDFHDLEDQISTHLLLPFDQDLTLPSILICNQTPAKLLIFPSSSAISVDTLF